MPRKETMDATGAASLILIAVILAVNQVVIKLGNQGMQPVFMAGLRSAGALIVLLIWMRARGLKITIEPSTVPSGLLLGVLFTVEFIFLFLALDLTSVGRTSILFYSMPVWLTIGAHFLLPDERITAMKSVGLMLAVAGVAVAVLTRDGGEISLLGDAFALGAALCWGAIALAARTLPIRRTFPEMQLIWQLGVSAILLLALAPFFGPFLRDATLLHWGLLAYQSLFVAFFCFLFWFWLLGKYPASSVASFSLLTPILGVFLGAVVFDEVISMNIGLALVLVCIGLWLINRPKRAVA